MNLPMEVCPACESHNIKHVADTSIIFQGRDELGVQQYSCNYCGLTFFTVDLVDDDEDDPDEEYERPDERLHPHQGEWC